jgi:hypothetical protein
VVLADRHPSPQLRCPARCLAAWTVLIGIGLLTSSPVAAGPPAVDQTDVPLVKAAIIYNICKFVEWPPGASDGDDFVIGTTVAGPNEPALAALAGKQIHGRNLRVIEVTTVAALSSCQAVFLGKAHLDGDPLVALAGKPILTFSDATSPGAIATTIELVSDGTRIRFDIHRRSAEHAGLRFSSQLLKLALSVAED